MARRSGIVLKVLGALLWVALASMARAQEQPAAYDSRARQAILIDGMSGKVLYEKSADDLIAPASMSKLMTVVPVFEALKAGKLTLDQDIPISEYAWRHGGGQSGGSTMYAEVNSRIPLKDVLQGIITQSANDGAIAVAEALAGSESAYADRLTARARQLGLIKSTFRNATGLDDPEHKMTARELAIVAKYIIDHFPDYYAYYSQPSFTWNNITQQNRNPLLKDYPGADGMKTGYTKEAGYGLVGSAVRDGRRLIMVVAGLPSIKDRREEAQKLLDWGFRRFRSIDVYAANETVGRARIWGGSERWVPLIVANPVRLALSPDEQDRVDVELRYAGPLMAPVQAGARVGSVRFMVDGNPIAEVEVQAARSVAAGSSMWNKAMDTLLFMVFGG